MSINRRALFALAVFCISGVIVGCGDKKSAAENQEIENAINEGRNAAKVLINAEIKDSTQLQYLLLEAKAKQSKYLIEERPELVEAFDSAFFCLIRSVKPEIEKQIRK